MKKFIEKSIIIFIDILSLVGMFYITLFIRKSIEEFGFPKFDEIVLQEFSFVILIILGLLYYEKIYKFNFDFWQETLKIIKAFFVGFVVVLSILALTKTNFEYSRTFIVIYFVFGVIFIPILKRYTKKFLYSFDYFRKKVLIVGNDEQIEIFKNEFDQNWYLGQMYVTKGYESVIVAPLGMNIEKLNETVTKYLNTSKELYVVPYLTDINLAHSNIMEYSNIRYNTIQIENKLLIKSNIWIKSISDKLIVALISPFFLLVHILISIAIRLDSKGVILFKQHRLGQDNIDFECYKYRSMYENSDDILKDYLDNNPDEIEYYDIYHKYKNDPRITKVGRFLRATSLDELPQIFNIIKGEMSLVGPRPYMLNESEKLGEHQQFILRVKPGITGLWQVSGRSELTFKERNELEIWYIKNWSLWADVVILIKTIKVVLLKVGAR
jgi:undecaprenyl-phosphate galactose phosphotransferase